jgi:hypothetical protein
MSFVGTACPRQKESPSGMGRSAGLVFNLGTTRYGLSLPCAREGSREPYGGSTDLPRRAPAGLFLGSAYAGGPV